LILGSLHGSGVFFERASLLQLSRDPSLQRVE
jgi:hypothetical protein